MKDLLFQLKEIVKYREEKYDDLASNLDFHIEYPHTDADEKVSGLLRRVA